ncbi:MAG: hypothetical protein JETT_0265 [Candidatus Jettenia ecosi]|uniref:Uncharacterized protein n=1 Tax=Candidatus Jettenia ecosi TaxID=2494326 RepID=A0A533QF99_9BACT|nr:MAG: hypothetical protein JETT_0265 [Candidatus Jettenia ecosi]
MESVEAEVVYKQIAERNKNANIADVLTGLLLGNLKLNCLRQQLMKK